MTDAVSHKRYPPLHTATGMELDAIAKGWGVLPRTVTRAPCQTHNKVETDEDFRDRIEQFAKDRGVPIWGLEYRPEDWGGKFTHDPFVAGILADSPSAPLPSDWRDGANGQPTPGAPRAASSPVGASAPPPTPTPGPIPPDAPTGRYEALGSAVGRLVETKQAAYGDSFGKSGAVMRILYPNGIPPEAMDDALTVVRVLDKLFRIATDRDALGETPWRDIAGYALLATARTDARGGGAMTDRGRYDATKSTKRTCVCTLCGAPFQSFQSNATYCGPECSKEGKRLLAAERKRAKR